jgi:hypothetical protein
MKINNDKKLPEEIIDVLNRDTGSIPDFSIITKITRKQNILNNVLVEAAHRKAINTLETMIDLMHFLPNHFLFTNYIFAIEDERLMRLVVNKLKEVGYDDDDLSYMKESTKNQLLIDTLEDVYGI